MTQPDKALSQSVAGIAPLPLLLAIGIMLGITIRPQLLASASGRADQFAAMLLFWAMAAGFVRGVGFIPKNFALRWLFSGWSCLLGLGLALWRLLG